MDTDKEVASPEFLLKKRHPSIFEMSKGKKKLAKRPRREFFVVHLIIRGANVERITLSGDRVKERSLSGQRAASDHPTTPFVILFVPIGVGPPENALY